MVFPHPQNVNRTIFVPARQFYSWTLPDFCPIIGSSGTKFFPPAVPRHMNTGLSDRQRLLDLHIDPEAMSAELIRIDAIAALLLASVGKSADPGSTPSEKLNAYVAAKRAEMKAESLDLGDAMEVIGAVANLVKMFNGVI